MFPCSPNTLAKLVPNARVGSRFGTRDEIWSHRPASAPSEMWSAVWTRSNGDTGGSPLSLQYAAQRSQASL